MCTCSKGMKVLKSALSRTLKSYVGSYKYIDENEHLPVVNVFQEHGGTIKRNLRAIELHLVTFRGEKKRPNCPELKEKGEIRATYC